MILAVVVAMIYATVLGLVVMASEENGLVLSLGLTNEYGLQQIAFWCFLILLLMCSQGYFWARMTFRWRRDDRNAAVGR